jgi:Rod binding domain-containing protein
MSELPLPGAPLAARAIPRPDQTRAPDELRRAAEEFEAVFLAEMLSPMFDALDTEGLGGGGMGEQMFRPMLVERYAEAIARAGGVGIADSVVRELMRLQETIIPPEAADGAAG